MFRMLLRIPASIIPRSGRGRNLFLQNAAGSAGQKEKGPAKSTDFAGVVETGGLEPSTSRM